MNVIFIRTGAVMARTALFAGVCALGACAGSSKPDPDPTLPEGSQAELALLETVEQLATSLRELSLLRQMRDYSGYVDLSLPLDDFADSRYAAPLYLPGWNGPIEPLLSQLCRKLEIECQVYGAPPAPPIYVALPAAERPAAAILMDVGLQAGERANVVLRPDVIELHYPDHPDGLVDPQR